MRDEVIACSGALFGVGDDEWAIHGFDLVKCDELFRQTGFSFVIEILCVSDILTNFQPFCEMLDQAANLDDAKDVFEEFYRLMSFRRVDNLYIYILLFKAKELKMEMGYRLLCSSTYLILTFELHRLSILVDIFVHLQDVENLKLVVETRLNNAFIYDPQNSDIQKQILIASKILALKSLQDYPALIAFARELVEENSSLDSALLLNPEDRYKLALEAILATDSIEDLRNFAGFLTDDKAELVRQIIKEKEETATT
jgi:hypothetical protein